MATPQESRNFSFRKLGKHLVIIAALSFPVWYVGQHIHITLTKSLTQRAFWYVEDDQKRPIKDGEYVVFQQVIRKPANTKETFIEHIAFKLFSTKSDTARLTFIKRVGCTGGETLKVDADDEFYCNGNYLGKAKHISLAGEKVKPFRYNGPVPVGSVFAIGDHPDSYDSRYYGFITRDRIKEVAWALY